ncbi:MAG: signal peptidase II [Patescibacteria group bacterium]
MRRASVIAVSVAIIAADRLSKLFAMRLPEPGPFSFSDVLTTTHHQNFGLLADTRVPMFLIYLVTMIVIALVVAAFVMADRKKNARDMLALAIIFGGAVGNLWDRIQWGYVFDWILVFHTSILNVADIAIGFGLLLYILNHTRSTSRLDNQPKTP